ncbi:sensor histidine kinase [Trinickia dinghuensis]|uniref:sensor histidine kinase n=1 Tax=Trinickia dinghuensis TaxID=2291023 RepID=UPI001FE665AF|nr:ATP-binding protein [Trinickia dinghuensis]
MDFSTVVPLVAGAIPAADRPRRRGGVRFPGSPAAPAGFSEEHKGERQLREHAAELDEAREEIKRHVARELHDGLGAELTATRFALANVEHALSAGGDVAAAATAALALAQQSLEAACEAGRRLIQDLHEPNVEGGIVSALAEWTRAFSERTGLATSFVCAADVRLTQLPPEAALAVMRVAQEALNNVAKHADASRADIRIQTDAKRLMLVIEDDGRGMPPRARHAGAPESINARGFGLPGMRARCEGFGGAVRIASRLRDDASGPYGAWPADTTAPAGRSGTTVRAHFLWAAMAHERGATAGLRSASTRVTRAR